MAQSSLVSSNLNTRNGVTLIELNEAPQSPSNLDNPNNPNHPRSCSALKLLITYSNFCSLGYLHRDVKAQAEAYSSNISNNHNTSDTFNKLSNIHNNNQ